MAKDFIRTIEEGMEKSKTCNATFNSDGETTKKTTKKITKKAKVEESVVEEGKEIDATPVQSDDIDEVETAPWDEDEELDLFDEDDSIEDETFDEEAVKKAIRAKNKTADAATKKKVLELRGETLLNDIHDEKLLKEMLKALA